MRLIDADALKKEIRENDPFGGMNYELYIDHAPTIPSPRWVRCEDELPKEYDTVLAYVDPWHIVSASYSKYRGWKEADGFNVVGVTYWMPIEPPKEG